MNIGLNSFLIPEFGAIGAAFATLITQSIVALAQVIYVIYHFKLQPNWMLFVQFLGFIGVLVGLNLVLSNGTYWSFFIILILQILTLFLFKIVDLRELKTLLTSTVKKELNEG